MCANVGFHFLQPAENFIKKFIENSAKVHRKFICSSFLGDAQKVNEIFAAHGLLVHGLEPLLDPVHLPRRGVDERLLEARDVAVDPE